MVLVDAPRPEVKERRFAGALWIAVRARPVHAAARRGALAQVLKTAPRVSVQLLGEEIKPLIRVTRLLERSKEEPHDETRAHDQVRPHVEAPKRTARANAQPLVEM